MARKQTTTIRIDEETKQRLEQLKIDLANLSRQWETMDTTIRQLLEFGEALKELKRTETERE